MLTELVEILKLSQIAHLQRPSLEICDNRSEQGIALLGTTVVLALVMGLLVWGTLVMTRQSAISAYQVNNANQARTAALIGISALTQYAQNQYAPTATTASAAGNTNTNPISSFLSGFLTSSSPSLPTSGNGAVATYVPVGTNAATSIAFSAPYMAATVSAVVTANTFSVSPSPTGTPGQIIIMSQGASGSARATATAVLYGKIVNTPPTEDLQNKILLSVNSTLNGNQFGGATIGATVGSVINGTTVSGTPGTIIGTNPNNIEVVSNIPAVNPDGFKSYASIELLYNNGSPEMIIPQSAAALYAISGVVPGTYGMTCSFFGCSGNTTAAQNAFSALGISYASGGSVNQGQWTLSNNKISGFIYSDGDVNIGFSGTDYISVAADGTVTTAPTNGNGHTSNDLFPFAQYVPTGSDNICSVFENVCQQGQPIQDLLGVSIISNAGVGLIHGSTIEGDIGSNGTITYNGGGSITINGAIVASGMNVSGGSSITVEGATKGDGLTSPDNGATFSGGQQTMSLQSLYWN